MIVKELIDNLQKMPQDVDVQYIRWEEEFGWVACEINLVSDETVNNNCVALSPSELI